MPNNSRRKSDVFELLPRSDNNEDNVVEQLKKKSSSNRRKTINPARLKHQKLDVENQENELTNHSQISISSKATPYKHRVHMGGAASYYFKNVGKTPLQKTLESARKKHHTNNTSFSISSKQLDTSYLSNSSDSSSGDMNNDSLNSSTDEAMNELKRMLDTSQVSTASNGTNQSFKSKSSTLDSSSGGSSDALNQSVLSDTTELTASNYVFTASSKQCLLEYARQEKKQKEKETVNRAKQSPTSESMEESTISVAEAAGRKPLGDITGTPTKPNDIRASPSPIPNPVPLPRQANASRESILEEESKEDLKETAEAANWSTENLNNTTMNLSKDTTEQQVANTSFAASQSSVKKTETSLLRSRVQVSPKSIRRFTDSLKKNRLQRKFERDQDIKRRLSMGSARKQGPPLRPQTENHGEKQAVSVTVMQRLSMSSAAGRNSRRNSMGSTLMQRRSSLSSHDDSTGELNLSQWNLSHKMAQSPSGSTSVSGRHEEDGVLSQASKEQQLSEAEKPMYENDDTADFSFEYDKWIREPIHTKTLDEPSSSVHNSRSAAMLRRLSRDKDNDSNSNVAQEDGQGLTTEDMHASTESNNQTQGSMNAGSSSTEKMDAAEGKVNPTLERPEDDGAESDSSIDKLLDGIVLDESHLSANSERNNPNTMSFSRQDRVTELFDPSSEISSSRSRRGSPQDSSNRRASLPAEIAFPSQETPAVATENEHQNQSAIHSPATDEPVSNLNRRPGSASKLTPTRLSKKPRRIVNPDSLLSPAKNTRSAKKKIQAGLNSVASWGTMTNGASDNAQNHEDANTSRRESNEQSVASGESVTASLGDLRELLELGSDMQDYTGGQRDNSRRETASVADFGELVGFLNNDEGEDSSRRSSVRVNMRRRRSSHYRTSLASLPEQRPVTDLASPSGNKPSDMSESKSIVGLQDILEDDTSSLASQTKTSSRRASKRRRRSSIMSLPTVDSEDQSLADENDHAEYSNEASARATDLLKNDTPTPEKVTDAGGEETMHSKKSNAESSSASTADLEELFGDFISPRDTSEKSTVDNDPDQNNDVVEKNESASFSTISNESQQSKNPEATSRQKIHSKAQSPSLQSSLHTSSEQSSTEELGSLFDGVSPGSTTDKHAFVGDDTLSGTTGALLEKSLAMSEERKSSPASHRKSDLSMESSESEVSANRSGDGQTASIADIGEIFGHISSGEERNKDNASTFAAEDKNITEESSPSLKRQIGSTSPAKQNTLNSSEKKAKRLKLDNSDVEHAQLSVLKDDEDCTMESAFPTREEAGGALTSIPKDGDCTPPPDHQRSVPDSRNQMSSLRSAHRYVFLNSALKKPRAYGDKRNSNESTSKKIVGFRSPEAAEYDVGSTSMSYTPMPKNQAKALFAIPSPSENESMAPSTATNSSSKAKYDGDFQMEEDQTVTLELDMKHLLENIDGHYGQTMGSEIQPENKEAEAMNESTGSNESVLDNKEKSNVEDMTVELEPDLNGLLASTLQSGLNNPRHAQQKGSGEVEGETVELESTLQSGLNNPRHAQQKESGEDEGETVELESSLHCLMQRADNEMGSSDDLDDSNTAEIPREASASSVEKTDKACIVSANTAAEVGSGQPLDGQKLNFETPSPASLDSSKHSSKDDGSCGPTEEQTIELEVDMGTLIEKVGSHHNSESEIKKLNRLDVSEIPLNSPSDAGSPSENMQTQTESLDTTNDFSVSQNSAFERPTQEVTVPLERNVQELCAATQAEYELKEPNSKPDFSVASDKETVELEENMAMVLNKANFEQKRTTIAFDMQDTPDSRRSRRSSISSHRLSLAPEGRLSVSKIGNLSVEGFHKYENEVDSRSSLEEANAMLDLKFEELLGAASLQTVIKPQQEDLLVICTEAAIREIQHDEVLKDECCKLIDVVCNELEKNIEDISDPITSFAKLLEEDPELFVDLQKRIRSIQNGEEAKELLESLGSATMKSVELEWTNWLGAVVGSLEGPIDSVLGDMSKDIEKLEAALNSVDEGHGLVAKMADASARRARRKSLNRRKVRFLSFHICFVVAPLVCLAPLTKTIIVYRHPLRALKTKLSNLRPRLLNLRYT